MLAISELVKTFRGTAGRRDSVAAVRGVSLEVEAGSFFTILGPSGCGKSTLLRCVAGLETPDAGHIAIDGQTVFASDKGVETPAVRRPIAMVFQSYAIWPHMTVFDNAAFPLRHGRFQASRPQIELRVMDMLERVGLASVARGWATQLSGGQQQRLALARALLCDPKLLLLDEPLSNLDTTLRVALRAELKSFQRSVGVTTVYVTHDQSEALALADRVAVMADGQLQQLGTPEEVYNTPATAFVAGFIGSANLIPVRDGAAPFGSLACALPTGGQGTLAIRPEHVLVHATCPEGRPNVFPTTVVACDFLGDRRDCTLALCGVTLRASAPASLNLAADAQVWVELPAEHVRFLPDTPSPSGRGSG